MAPIMSLSFAKALNPSVFSLQHPRLIMLPYIKIILGRFKELFILGAILKQKSMDLP